MDTKRPLILGLYSPAPQSGKSTIANYLVANHGFKRGSFAAALKAMVASLMSSAGFTKAEIEFLSEAGKEHRLEIFGGKSYRNLCQTLGTEWGRNLVSPSLWVDVLLKQGNPAQRLVIDDMRFPNEFDAVKNAGGFALHVFRSGAAPTNGHKSEGLLNDHRFDAYVLNHTIRHLHEQVEDALGRFDGS